jgi:hypothetical protein
MVSLQISLALLLVNENNYGNEFIFSFQTPNITKKKL